MRKTSLETVFHDLDPALRVLSGGDAGLLRLVSGKTVPGAHIIEQYAAVPRLSDPRALLPLAATALAWPAILGQHAAGAANPIARAAARILEIASKFGMAPLFLRDRVSVVANASDLLHTPLHDFLGDVLGRRDFFTSFRIAPRRPNGKPVVQAVAHDGTVLAYAKFGWEKLTRRLVQHEAAVLDELAPLTRGTALHVPKIIYKGAWHGFETLVVAPLSDGGRTPRTLLDLPLAAADAMGNLRPERCERLGDSAFWRRTTTQAALLAPMLGMHACGVVLQACSAIEERWGDVRLQIGQSHGDWIPPNISIRPDAGFNVWDWERSEDDIPLGIDTMQFILFLEARRHTLDRRPGWRALARGREALRDHGLQKKQVTLLTCLSLLRSILWFGEAREAGRDEDEDQQFVMMLEECLYSNPDKASVPSAS